MARNPPAAAMREAKKETQIAKAEADAIAKTKGDNNFRSDDDALSTSLYRENFRNEIHVARNPEVLTGLLKAGGVDLKPGVTANEVFEQVIQKPIGQRLLPEEYLSPTYVGVSGSVS